MASITQTIPHYHGGISQQPDEKKLPGQVIEAKNVLPDLTRGLLKRPGGKLIKQIGYETPGDGKWFHYYRDENEQYIGRIAKNSTVNMFRCSDGESISVTNNLMKIRYSDWSPSRDTSGVWTIPLTGANSEDGLPAVGDLVFCDFSLGYTADVNLRVTEIVSDTEIKLQETTGEAEYTEIAGSISAQLRWNYLVHNNDDDLQTLTLNDYTYITNRAITTKMADTVEPARPPECFIELKKVSYSRQYSVNLYDDVTSSPESVYTATRIDITREIDSSNGCNDSNGNQPSDGTLHGSSGFVSRCTTGNLRDALCPNVSTKLFAINHGDSGENSDANETAHTYTVTPNGGNASDRKHLYFRITTTGQAVADDGSTPTYHCRYTTTHDLLYGGEGWRTGDYFYVWMKDAKYKITIKEHSESKVHANLGLIRPAPTSFDTKTTVTVESILGDMRTAILGTTDGGENTKYDWDVDDIKQIGNGLYITRSSGKFNVNSPATDTLNVFTDSVQDIADLPGQCKHGYVVKVANSIAEEDDYFVKFIGKKKDDGTYLDGEGVWEECPEPGRKVTFDASTMPVQLVRQADGTFILDKVTWENCLVGDTLTVSEPSFIGKTINNLLFFRNRLVLLSDENVIMSQPGEFFNFWPKSAITYTATDNIDLSCSSEYPAIVYDAIQVNSGLVLFTKNQQFMLTTDSDVLSPQTAKINALASYNFNYKTSPISLGTTIAFLDNAGQYSRFWEMSKVLREGEPDVIDQTKLVTKLFDKEVNLISNSRENGIVFFSKRNTSTLYGFRYFNASNERLHQAWFTWEVTGTIQYHAILDDSLYVVVRNNEDSPKDSIQKFSVKMHTDTIAITDDKNNSDATDDEIYRMHLDAASAVTINAGTYDAVTDKTTFSKPSGYENTTAQLCLYDNNTSSDSVGNYSTATIVGSNIEVTGDWSDRTVILGYLFDMQVKFPTIYYTQTADDLVKADTTASLIIHRIKLNFGDHGLYSTTIDRLGKPSYTEIWEAPISDQYLLNNLAIDDEVTKTIPTYERNKNLTITLKSSHPSPATLYSMTWEGDYTSKFYNRV